MHYTLITYFSKPVEANVLTHYILLTNFSKQLLKVRFFNTLHFAYLFFYAVEANFLMLCIHHSKWGLLCLYIYLFIIVFLFLFLFSFLWRGGALCT